MTDLQPELTSLCSLQNAAALNSKELDEQDDNFAAEKEKTGMCYMLTRQFSGIYCISGGDPYESCGDARRYFYFFCGEGWVF